MSKSLDKISSLFNEKEKFEIIVLNNAKNWFEKNNHLIKSELPEWAGLVPTLKKQYALANATACFIDSISNDCNKAQREIQKKIDSIDSTEKSVEIIRTYNDKILQIILAIGSLLEYYPTLSKKSLTEVLNTSLKIEKIKANSKEIYTMDIIERGEFIRNISSVNASGFALFEFLSSKIKYYKQDVYNYPLMISMKYLIDVNEYVLSNNKHIWDDFFEMRQEEKVEGLSFSTLALKDPFKKSFDRAYLNLSAGFIQKVYDALKYDFDEPAREKLHLFLSNKPFKGMICYMGKHPDPFISVFYRLKDAGEIKVHTLDSLEQLLRSKFLYFSYKKENRPIEFGKRFFDKHSHGRHHLLKGKPILIEGLPLRGKSRI